MMGAMQQTIYILNGPNLNFLGKREPEIYGSVTLDEIERGCVTHAAERGYAVRCLQSNHEGQLVDWIQEATDKAAGIIINAGAFTHTSVALHDALRACALPIIELHISNIFKRESFRHHSYISEPATGIICGFGVKGYRLALDAMHTLLED